jgi:hypothetical protein
MIKYDIAPLKNTPERTIKRKTFVSGKWFYFVILRIRKAFLFPPPDGKDQASIIRAHGGNDKSPVSIHEKHGKAGKHPGRASPCGVPYEGIIDAGRVDDSAPETNRP